MAAAAPRTKAPAPAPASKAGPSKVGAPTAPRGPGGVVKGPPGPAVRLADAKAAKDPRLQQALHKVERNAAHAKEHPPAEKKAAEAEAAARPPEREQLAGAQANQVGVMEKAPVSKPEPDSFLTLLRAEIDKVMPKSLGETENFLKGDKQEKLKGALTSNIDQQKAQATSGLTAAKEQAPDPNTIPAKPATPLAGEDAPPPAIPIGAAGAMPLPKTDAEVSQQSSKDDATKQLADAELTSEQLKKANDPRFSAVLTAKGEVDKHADAAPKAYRAQEQKTLAQAAAGANAAEKTGLGAFHGAVTKSAHGVLLKQGDTQKSDEEERKRVVAEIQTAFINTKTAVDTKLASLESEASDLFDKGCEDAINGMKDGINRRLDKWKDDRYSGALGGLKWAKDKLVGLPDDVEVFYEDGRKQLRNDLDKLVVRVANLVEKRLAEAKAEVAKGEKAVQEIVDKQPKELKQAALDAQKDVAGKFDELRQSIDDKKTDLAQGLAQKYKEAVDKGEKAIKAIQDENKGLLNKLADAIREVIEILRQFKEKLLGILRKAVAAIKLIVADPIGFLGNLLSAIKKGFLQFVDNIWTHLKAGFLAWLFGSFADMGITPPKDFSLGSIFKLVLEVLGLTYDAIRGIAVKIIGERNVKILEKAWELISALITGGFDKFWEKVKEYVGDLKAMLIDAIQDWIVTTVIKKAIMKLATMFNPVGAIIQAALMIIDAVVFFVSKLAQLAELVDAIVSSVYAIAQGQIAAAANWIEKSLARLIPILIGLLASLIGLSGITDRIKGFVQKIRTTIHNAIEKFIRSVLGTIGKLFGMGDKKKEEKVEPDAQSQGVRGLAQAALLQRIGDSHTEEQAEAIAAQVLAEYQPQGLKRLRVVVDPAGEGYTILAQASEEHPIVDLTIAGEHSVTLRADIELRELEPGAEPGSGKLAGVAAFARRGKKDAQGNVIMKDGEPVLEVAPDLGAAIEPVRLEGSGRSRSAAAGGIVSPFAPGATKLEVHTWNVGEPEKGSSASHAERQLQSFLDRNRSIFDRIVKLHIQITKSPCADCIGTLLEIHRQIPGAAISLTYQKAYKSRYDPSKSTTSAMLGRLTGKIKVDGPDVDGKQKLKAKPAGK